MGNYNSELYHYGIKGMRWGVRRYQNKDGSLTPAGKKRAQRDADKLKKPSVRLLIRTMIIEGRRVSIT